MKKFPVILCLVFTVLFLSSCAVTQNIGGKKEVLSAKSLSTMKPGRSYTFYNKNGLKYQIKILKIDSTMVYGTFKGKEKESFEKSFEEIINENHRVTTVSGEGIAGNILIAGAVTAAVVAITVLAFYALLFSW